MALSPEPSDGLVFAHVLDGEHGSRGVGWADIRGWTPTDGFLWVHLHHGAESTQAWLEGGAGLDPLVAEALLAEETRPRCVAMGDGLLVNLRAVNLNPGADPEDMVSLRIWIEERRAITVRRRRVMAVRDVSGTLDAGRGPSTAGELLAALADGIAERMAEPIAGVEEAVDELEEQVVDAQSFELRTRLGQLRRQAIALRRYLAPQREVLNRLQSESRPWIAARDQLHLREIGDRVTRYVEDLDSARERAAVAQEELTNRLAEHTNHTMQQLAIVATIFLPLGLLTGLLGVNVAGIPGAENGSAFAIVCGVLAVMAVGLYLFFRRRRVL